MVLQEQEANNAAGIFLYVLSLTLIIAALTVLALREQKPDTGAAAPINDEVLEWGWYDRVAANTRRRIDRLVGSALPTDSTKAEPLAPNESSGLIKR